MLGKPEWFERRKFMGWGIKPKTWQGGLYLVALLAPLIIFVSYFKGAEEVKFGVVGLWVVFVLLDTLDIMRKLNKDEREERHEAIAERNAAWFMVAVLTVGFGYDMIMSTIQGVFAVHPFIVVALFGAVVVKAVSNYWLERNE